MAKVSVIVPAHNSEQFLRPCLNSLVNQTLSDIEILVINDHSTDATKKIATSYEKEYPSKVKVLDLPGKTGVSAARNYGLANAQGEKIGFVDSDDVVSITMYQELYKYMQATRRNIGISSISFIDEKKYTEGSALYKSADIYRKKCINYLIQKEKYFNSPISCWNKLYNRQILEGVSFLEQNIYEDVGFTKFILLKDPQVIYLRRKDYLYRENSNGISNFIDQPNDRILNLKNVCLDALEKGKSASFSPEKMRMLTESLKDFLISQLEDLFFWPISDEDKYMILTRLYSIYNYYFPDLLAFENERLCEKAFAIMSELAIPLTPLPITNVEKEEQQVLERIRQIKKEKVL